MTAKNDRSGPGFPAAIRKRVTGGVLLLLAYGTLTAAAGEWNGYEQRDLVVDGRKALLVVPKAPASGKPWIWRMEFFGHEPQGDIALLGKGFHVAYIDLQNLYGAPVALDSMDRFYAHLTKELGHVVVQEFFSFFLWGRCGAFLEKG